MQGGIYNASLIDASQRKARNKLNKMGGIMASSTELMQAAMPTPPAPRPMAQRPGVKKLADGGDTFLDHYKSPALKKALGKDFKTTAEFGQKAITSAKAEDLGLPQELTDQMEVRRDEIVNQPEVAAQNNIAENVPENQRTGDLQKDLVKAATNLGIERVPAEAEIDELNKAIAGAQLGAALAGSYVNPNTGQELRPTAGARIASAAAQGLMLARDTETRRAEQEAALAAAKIKAAGKSTSGKNWMGTDQGKAFMKLWQEYSGDGNRSVQEVLADIKEVAPGLVAEAVASGYIADTSTPAQSTPTASGGGQVVVEGEIIYSVDANGNKVQVGTYDAETKTAKDMSGNVVKPR